MKTKTKIKKSTKKDSTNSTKKGFKPGFEYLKVAGSPESSATQMELVFWSGMRKPKVFLRVDLMLIDSGVGLTPTTLMTVRESRDKHVSAMVTNVRHGRGVVRVSS
jgi:hypothetical protein